MENTSTLLRTLIVCYWLMFCLTYFSILFTSPSLQAAMDASLAYAEPLLGEGFASIIFLLTTLLHLVVTVALWNLNHFSRIPFLILGLIIFLPSLNMPDIISSHATYFLDALTSMVFGAIIFMIYSPVSETLLKRSPKGLR